MLYEDIFHTTTKMSDIVDPLYELGATQKTIIDLLKILYAKVYLFTLIVGIVIVNAGESIFCDQIQAL